MTRTCDVPGCEGKHRARGLCAKHVNRQYQYGDARAPLQWRFYTAREDQHLLDLPTHPKSGYVKYGALGELALAFGRPVQSLSTRRRKLLRERAALA